MSFNCKNECGLKSLTLAHAKVITVNATSLKSVNWHKVKDAFKFHQI